MTAQYWILLIGLIITILIMIILNTFSSETISPKYIANSYDPYQKAEFDSILLKSLQKYIGKYFNHDQQKTSINEISKINYDSIKIDKIGTENENLQNNNSHANEILQQYEKSKLKFSNSTKISMYPDSDYKMIYILSVSNERDSNTHFDSKIGQISLYSIPMKNLITNDASPYDLLENSLIKLCWTSRFYGKIVGAVSSSDKKQISVFYRIIKGHTVTYRIRYFHNINCNNVGIEKTDEEIDKEYQNYLLSKNIKYNTKTSKEFRQFQQQESNEFIDHYFEISEKSNHEEKNVDSSSISSLANYFNDETYDDLSLSGNTPIVAMAIKSNVIAYARNVDFRQFYILKRDNVDGKRLWKVSFLGPLLDKKVDQLFHTNSLKFVHDGYSKADYKLTHIFLTANTSGIHLNQNLIKANDTDYHNIYNTTEDNSYNLNIIRIPLNDEIITDNYNTNQEEFNLETSIKNFKDYMRPTVFSNSPNNKHIAYEIAKGIVYYLAFSDTKSQVAWIQYKFHKNERVSKISADSKNENKFENLNEFTYIFLYKEKDKEKSSEYKDIVKTINLKALPKKYRNKEISTFFVERIDEKIILFILNTDGVIISMDLTKFPNKWRKNWLVLFIQEFNQTASVIMIANVLTIGFYLFYLRNRRRQIQTRNTEINQVVQDIIRLNNIQMALGNNLANGLLNHNAQDTQNDQTNNINSNNLIDNSINNVLDESNRNTQNQIHPQSEINLNNDNAPLIEVDDINIVEQINQNNSNDFSYENREDVLQSINEDHNLQNEDNQ